MNHFDEFCKFIHAQTWMSETMQGTLIGKLAAAMKDAYDRGVASVSKKAA